MQAGSALGTIKEPMVITIANLELQLKMLIVLVALLSSFLCDTNVEMEKLSS